ncbi:MAG: hypothetical protein JWN44_4232 [Myxococcales bacterium]|nr:hypothetical protein [Myxococcales bacterium]
MRFNTLVAFGLFACALVAAVMVACSDSTPACKAGTLALQIELTGTANFADTINVQSFEPGASINEDFSHVPDGPRLFTIDVAFPGGYPANKTVTFLVRARGASTLLGENIATIHLGETCGAGLVGIRAETLDGGPSID